MLTAGALVGRPAAAAAVGDGETPGRYQIVYGIVDTGGARKESAALMIDTATGQCWIKDVSEPQTGWTTLGSPAKAK